MQVSMKLEMKDSPGQLVAALKPISEVGGNIIAVIHQRDESKEGDILGVQIVLDIAEQKLSDLLSLIRAQGVNVVRLGKERLLYTRTVIMIGHIMHTDISDTVDQIDRTGYAEVSELSLVMPAINERSSARITLKTATATDMNRAVALLRKVSAAKEILIVEPLEECG